MRNSLEARFPKTLATSYNDVSMIERFGDAKFISNQGSRNTACKTIDLSNKPKVKINKKDISSYYDSYITPLDTNKFKSHQSQNKDDVSPLKGTLSGNESLITPNLQNKVEMNNKK